MAQQAAPGTGKIVLCFRLVCKRAERETARCRVYRGLCFCCSPSHPDSLQRALPQSCRPTAGHKPCSDMLTKCGQDHKNTELGQRTRRSCGESWLLPTSPAHFGLWSHRFRQLFLIPTCARTSPGTKPCMFPVTLLHWKHVMPQAVKNRHCLNC
jgi:hypothetical protein